MNDLTGYVIYYGSSPTELISSVPVSGAETTSAIIDNLAVGATYYFAIAAVSATSGESAKSATVAKTI